MDVEQSNSYDSGSGLAATGIPPDKKKILIIAGVGLFVVILLGVVLLIISNSNRNTGQNGTGNKISQNITKMPLQQTQKTPGQAAKDFHDWYVNHPSPLISGAYKTRSDISSEYKFVMARYVGRGFPTDRDPVFNCGDFPLPKNVIALAPEYDESQNQALVILQEEQAKRNLYEIKLAKIGDAWLVRDVWCAP